MDFLFWKLVFLATSYSASEVMPTIALLCINPAVEHQVCLMMMAGTIIIQVNKSPYFEMPIWDSSQGSNVLRTEFSTIWYPEWYKQLWKLMAIISRKSSQLLLFNRSVMSNPFVTPWTVAQPGSSSLGISQAKILEQVAISFSRGSPWPMDWIQVSRIAGKLYHWATREVITCYEDIFFKCSYSNNIAIRSSCKVYQKCEVRVTKFDNNVMQVKLGNYIKYVCSERKAINPFCVNIYFIAAKQPVYIWASPFLSSETERKI